MRRAVMFLIFAAILVVSILGYRGAGPAPSKPERVQGGQNAAVIALREPLYQPVIDPGHGGEDGGAVSLTGTNESSYNLDIALKMSSFMRFMGLSPSMTRETDVSIHDPAMVSLADKKNSDLKNRYRLVNSIPNAVLISIHQNEFEQSDVKGAEVYYNHHAQSKGLAEAVQSVLVTRLDPSNRRTSKKIGANILMNNITVPGILVECGFISNPEEERLLAASDYQLKLALTIATSYLNWTEGST